MNDSFWTRTRMWMAGILAVVVSIAIAIIAIFRRGKNAARKDMKRELETTEHQAEIEMEKGRKKDHDEIKDIASDTDHDSRDERTDAWLREGVK